MDYCGPHGIPLSHFLGGPLVWTEFDREAALAWQAYNARRCGQCGTHIDEWKPAEGGDRHAYHAEHYTCPGCLKLAREQESPEVAKAGPGVHVRLASGQQSDCPRCKQNGGEPDGRGNEVSSIQGRNGHRGAPA